jgi:ring-1,2-phenylacetyl-CoA epoxidase subunit PaaB
MTDTQWRRFEVFVQTSEEAPLEYAGSVHAADFEIALMNARDVFVRRPRCRRLFVVPNEQVLFRTSEEFLSNGDRPQPDVSQRAPEGGAPSPYLVFAKAGHRGTLKCAGQVEATSEVQALEIATERLGIDRSGFWAAVAERAMIGNEFADAESLFTPAEAKSYRLHSDFPVNKLMREKSVKP